MNVQLTDTAYQQLIRFKVKQLNEVLDTFTFSHPLAYETIWLFVHKFDDTYNDNRRLSILNDAFLDFQTKEKSAKLYHSLTAWAYKHGYSYDDLF